MSTVDESIPLPKRELVSACLKLMSTVDEAIPLPKREHSCALETAYECIDVPFSHSVGLAGYNMIVRD